LRTGGLQSRVTTTTEEQWGTGLFTSVEGQDPADDDPVVTAFIDLIDRASECGKATLEQRSAVPADEREQRRIGFTRRRSRPELFLFLTKD
jgi:hypothetical protein